MRAVNAPAGIPLLLLWSLCPPFGLRATRPSVSMASASASAATASWQPVWIDEFERQDIDMTKWEFPEGGSTEEAGSAAVAAGGDDKQMSDVNSGSRSVQPPRHTPSHSSPRLQVYIGAYEYLVMVGTAAPPLSPQPTGIEGQDTAVPAAGEPAALDSSSRISMSMDFLYGRVEVRAKVASGGFSGFWLRPSEEHDTGSTPCALVAIAEIREAEGDPAERSISSVKASVNFGDFEESRLGCTSSDVWPRGDGGCSLPAKNGTDWSDGFHVYSLEWEEDEFRWYVDGFHYCTKTSWFAKDPGDFPAPFHKAFHFEMGVEAAGDGAGAGDSHGGGGGDAESPPAVLPEMIVDYVKIAQGPAGWWAPAADAVPEDGFPLNADGGMASARPPKALEIFLNALAVLACVLGPYMAMTGLRRPRTNTILMGVEIGAFKATNASYLLSGSYVMALVGAITVGLLVGFLAIRHRAMARWNTVAGLAVPVLFLLIDVGMISDIGSRYVCWAIFFVMTVTFAVLVFPSEHHAPGFAVASAATGSCVLKLGLGWLLGESGEIFKILDDPLGDRCHVSRVCQYLNFVMGAVFLIGLCSQWVLRPPPEDKLTGGNSVVSLEKQRPPMFTPPRARFIWGGAAVRPGAMQLRRKSTASSGSDFELRDGRDASSTAAAGEQQLAFGEVGREQEHQQPHSQCPENDDTLSEGYDDDEAFILGLGGKGRGGGIWERATTGARRILDRVLHPILSYRHHQVPISVHPDSPTPVPMPSSGPGSNTVVSNQGDTIELVIHSPHKGSQSRRQPSGWLSNGSGGGGGGGRGDHNNSLPQLSLGEGELEGDGDGRRRLGVTAGSTSSSNDYDDALSILSASELAAADDLAAATAAQPSQPDAATATSEGATRGRLADAFSDKWGAWIKDAHSDDGSTEGGGNGHQIKLGARSAGGGGRSAREFDHEALLLSPYVRPPPDMGTPALGTAAPGAAESEADHDARVASRFSCPSSSSSIYDERWLWRHRDGVLPPSSSNNSSGRASPHGDSAVAGGQNLPGLGKTVCGNTVGETKSSRGEGERCVSSGTDPVGVVGLHGEVTASAGVSLDHARGQGPSGESTAASLREIDI